MALYVGVACSRRRDLFKLCPHRRFTFTSGQSLITPTYDFCYKRRAIGPRPGRRHGNEYVKSSLCLCTCVRVVQNANVGTNHR